MKKHSSFIVVVVYLLGISTYFFLDSGIGYKRLILITGCMRSGTTYSAKLLTLAGMKIGHECMDKDGCVSWCMAVDSDCAPWGPGAKEYRFKYVFHQVRNPLKVISSLYSTSLASGRKISWTFVCRHIPEIRMEDTEIAKAAKYWYYWNLQAEKKAGYRFRIEDFDTAIDKIENKIGIKLDKLALSNLSRKTNNWGPIVNSITWEDIKNELSEKEYTGIQEMALRYGYLVGN